MAKWKNLLQSPPTSSCNICVRIGKNFETYYFNKVSNEGWEILKDMRVIEIKNIPSHAEYINLDGVE